jgi:hypothetical protein
MSQPRFKYPRTFHLPYSLKKGPDDKALSSDDIFTGKQVIVTEKMDGENTTIYNDYLHARSIDSEWDESKRWLDRLRAIITHDIPPGWRLCGENLFYKHTIPYTHLETLFYIYSIWDENNNCLSWKQTLEWCNLLRVKPIPVIYDGIYSQQAIIQAFNEYSTSAHDPVEGFVVRRADGFSYKEFSGSVAKFVSNRFQINTTKHWKYDVKELNQLNNNQNVWEIIS